MADPIEIHWTSAAYDSKWVFYNEKKYKIFMVMVCHNENSKKQRKIKTNIS